MTSEDIKLVISVGVPSLTVLAGILINNSRLSDLRNTMDTRFDDVIRLIGVRFDAQERVVDVRFEHVERRLDLLEKRMR